MLILLNKISKYRIYLLPLCEICVCFKGMAMFLKNTAFHGILLDILFISSQEVKKELVHLLNEGIKSGAVQPLPSTVFSESQVEQAFR